ncbi:ParB/RepB/Spo0J family partition protein [Trichocoleus sp. ST-U3]
MARKRSRPYGSDVTPVNSLDVLFGDSRLVAELVRTSDIKTRTQPRRYFDAEKLEQLVQSVKQHGILEPLLVRPLPDNQYELVAGERRYRSAIELELAEVPVVVRELNDTEALQLALVENLQREDLNPVEETEGILQLLALKLNLTLPEIPPLLYQMKNALEKDKGKDSEIRDNVIPNPDSDAEQGIQSVFNELRLMSWYSFTCNRLPLLRLPEEILEALRAGLIEYTKAKVIAQVKDEAERKTLLEEAIAQSLSLSEIRERVKAAQPQNEPPPLASRIETISKLVKKQKLWDDSKKRKKLESLLAKIEELIYERELTNELPHKSLTHAEMAKRLGVRSSALSNAKKRADFSEWSKSRDPEAIAWQWVAESKCFVPLKKQGG